MQLCVNLKGILDDLICIKLLRCISLAHLNIVVVLVFLKFLKIKYVSFLRYKSINTDARLYSRRRRSSIVKIHKAEVETY